MPNNKLTPAQKRAAAAKSAAAAKAKATADYNKSFDANWGWINSLVGLDKTPKGGKSLAWALDKIKTQKITDPNVAANILNQTNWYKNHSQTATQNLSQEKTNPGIFNQKVDELKAELVKEAATKGFVVSDDELHNIARTAYVYGQAINSATVINQLGEHKKSMSGGTYQASVDGLKQSAYDMGVDHLMDSNFYSTAAAQIALGNQTSEFYTNMIKDNAKSHYVAIADKLDAGLSVRQVASPYINTMASILELNPNDISVNDTYVSKAITSLDEKNNPAMVPLWKFQQDLRQDPRWQKTENAKQQYDSVARKVLTDMGLVS